MGAKRLEFRPEIGFGAAGGERCEVDGDDAGGQGFAGVPARGGGDDNGAVDFERERLASVPFFALEEGRTGGETAESIGEAGADGAGVVEGENPVVLGDGEQFLRRVGKREKRGGGGID